jgi:hypothetical protein
MSPWLKRLICGGVAVLIVSTAWDGFTGASYNGSPLLWLVALVVKLTDPLLDIAALVLATFAMQAWNAIEP